ncbi:hypothetical protein ElyMa_006276100 [Elysia marginata]|uniref:Uncharacterized protein n=1 Tax=Elysia marginata TaxID=1093978 RepID=A0AAV4HBK4_9GAST|nr:hypothetical protein ElyMa_006276100 [Elysia marginata]
MWEFSIERNNRGSFKACIGLRGNVKREDFLETFVVVDEKTISGDDARWNFPNPPPFTPRAKIRREIRSQLCDLEVLAHAPAPFLLLQSHKA